MRYCRGNRAATTVLVCQWFSIAFLHGPSIWADGHWFGVTETLTVLRDKFAVVAVESGTKSQFIHGKHRERRKQYDLFQRRFPVLYRPNGGGRPLDSCSCRRHVNTIPPMWRASFKHALHWCGRLAVGCLQGNHVATEIFACQWFFSYFPPLFLLMGGRWVVWCGGNCDCLSDRFGRHFCGSHWQNQRQLFNFHIESMWTVWKRALFRRGRVGRPLNSYRTVAITDAAWLPLRLCGGLAWPELVKVWWYLIRP